jgi:hypothetical protein
MAPPLERKRIASLPARLLICLLGLLAAISVMHASRNALAPGGSYDLGRPLKGAELLVREDPYQRFLDPLSAPMPRPGPDENPWPVHPIQAPSVLILFWPLSLVGWQAAKAIWLSLNLCFAAGLLLLAFRRFLPRRSLATYATIACLFLMSMPFRSLINNGQHLLAGLFFFLLALDLADRRRTVWAGAALALAMIKYSLILFLLPYLVLRRQWCALAIAGGIHLLATTVIAWRIGADPVAMVVDSAAIAQGLREEGYVDLFALAAGMGVDPLVPALAGGVVVALLLWLAVTRPAADADLFLAVLCVWSTLLVYHRGYDFVVFAIPLIVAVARWPTAKAFTGPLAMAIALYWYIYTAVPFLGGNQDGAIRWLIGFSCYAAGLAGLWLIVRGATTARNLAENAPPAQATGEASA